MSPETASLGEVASFIRWITFKPEDVAPRGTDGSVWCLRTKNVQAELDLSDVWAIDASFVKRSEQYLQAGDLLVSSANSWNLIGKCSWVPELESDSTFGGFVTVLRGNLQLVDRRYLYHWFSSSRTQAVVRSFSRQTTNIANLDLRRCAELVIPLPPLAQQKRIAALLDAVDALRAKRREAIALLDDFAQSIFLNMFGDPFVNRSGFEVRELEDLVAGGDRINYGVVQPGQHVEDGIPLIRSGDLGRLGVDRSSLMRISPEIESSYVRSRVKGNEILIGCVGAIGEVAVVSNDDVGSNVARAVARVPIADDADREYLAAYLRMDFAQRYFTRELRTVAQPTLNIKQIKSAPVLFPPSSLRSEFAEKVRCVTRQRVTHAAHLATLDELFTSLQHRAFSGALWDHEATGEAA